MISIKGQIFVAACAAAAGLTALGIFWLVASPEATYRNVAIATIIYAAAYVLAVPRVERWLKRNPSLVGVEHDALSTS